MCVKDSESERGLKWLSAVEDQPGAYRDREVLSADRFYPNSNNFNSGKGMNGHVPSSAAT